MIDDNLIKGLSVSISVNGCYSGSGFILTSIDSHLYCVSALHCIRVDGSESNDPIAENDQLILEVFKNKKWITLPILERLIDEENDLVIFQISGLEQTSFNQILIGEISREQKECYITGYHCEDGKSYRSLSGTIKGPNENLFYVNLTHLGITENLQMDQVRGVSGGGCILSEGYDNKFIGIEQRAVANDVSYNELICLNVTEINNLLKNNGWSDLPAPTYYYESVRMSKYHYANDILQEGEHKTNWINLDSMKSFFQKIQQHINSRDSENVLMICGLSGIGKTRTVLEACFQGNPHKSLYFKSYNEFLMAQDNIEDYFKHVDHGATIIIDDADFNDFHKINSWSCKFQGLRFILISATAKQLYENLFSNIFFIPSTSLEDVKQIIHEVDERLDDHSLNIICNLSDNDLHLAIMIAEMNRESSIIKGEDLSISVDKLQSRFNSPEEILSRRLDLFEKECQLSREDFSTALEILSLAVSIGFDDIFEKEISFLAEFFKFPETKLRTAIDVCAEIGLGTKHEFYFEFGPRALARMEFETTGWYKEKERLQEFWDSIPTNELRQKCYERILECEKKVGKEVSEALASWFCSRFNNLKLVQLTDDIALKTICYTEYYPDIGLSWLKNIISTASKEDIELFSTYRYGRRETIRCCTKLANFKEYFYLCESILYHLAEHETELWGNNSQGVWSEFFHMQASNTEIPFQDRLNLLIRRSALYTGEDFALYKKTYENMLRDSTIRWMPPKMVAGRITPENWHVETTDEIISEKRRILEQLQAAWGSFPIQMKSTIFSVLVNNITFFSEWGLLGNYHDAMEQFFSSQEDKNQLILEIERILHYSEIHEKPKPYRQQMESWLSSLRAHDIKGLLQEYLSRDGWILGEDEEKDKAKRIELYQLLCQEELKISILDQSFSNPTANDWRIEKFAFEIGLNDGEHEWLSYIISLFNDQRLYQAIVGYFKGASRESGLSKPLLSILGEFQNHYPKAVFDATLTSDITEQGLNRLLVILSTGFSDEKILLLQESTWSKIITEPKGQEILYRLVCQDKIAFSLHIACNWFQPKNKLFNDNSKKHFLGLLISHEYLLQKANPFDVVFLLKKLPETLLPKQIEVLEKITDFSKGFDITEQINFLVELAEIGKTSEILEMVGRCMLSAKGKIGTQSIHRLIAAMDSEMLESWVLKDPQTRASVLAFHLPAPNLKAFEVPKITDRILQTYQQDEFVFEEFWNGLHHLKVTNLNAVEANSQHTISLLTEYQSYNNPSIQQWAKKEILDIEETIERQRIRREREKRYIHE